MPKLSIDEIRARFEFSEDFNEIFDALEQAVEQRIEDIELYRTLFWNHHLTPDELCLFCDKISREFPRLAYDCYMWLANVFEVTYSMCDNYDLAISYFKKAASARPEEIDPYLDAADCYDPDVKIPPVHVLTEFLKQGTQRVRNPKPLYQRLSYLFELADNEELSKYYRRIADEGSSPPDEAPSAT